MSPTIIASGQGSDCNPTYLGPDFYANVDMYYIEHFLAVMMYEVFEKPLPYFCFEIERGGPGFHSK